MYMHKFLSLLLFFTVLSYQITAQIFPKEGSKLNYRLIGFAFPSEKQAVRYKIEIAKGGMLEENAFVKNIITTRYSEKNKIVAEVPSFGSQYTWRVVYI